MCTSLAEDGDMLASDLSTVHFVIACRLEEGFGFSVRHQVKLVGNQTFINR